MKKIFAVMITTAMLITAFSGCSQSSPDNTASKSAQSTTKATFKEENTKQNEQRITTTDEFPTVAEDE